MDVLEGHYYEAVYNACLVNKTKKRIQFLKESLSYGVCKGLINPKLMVCLKTEKARIINYLIKLGFKSALTKLSQELWMNSAQKDCIFYA